MSRLFRNFMALTILKTPNATISFLKEIHAMRRLWSAKTVGVDFIVNANLDRDLRLTQIFTGDLIEAHMKAYEMIKGYAEIPLDGEFDIVLTHGGYVGRDHYQTAKAGVGALPAVKKRGSLLLLLIPRSP